MLIVWIRMIIKLLLILENPDWWIKNCCEL